MKEADFKKIRCQLCWVGMGPGYISQPSKDPRQCNSCYNHNLRHNLSFDEAMGKTEMEAVRRKKSLESITGVMEDMRTPEQFAKDNNLPFKPDFSIED